MYRRCLTRLRKPILWLMVPMVLLVGRPAAGCVCADGTVLPVCCRSQPLLSGLCGPAGKECCAKPSVCPHCKRESSAKLPDGRCEVQKGDCGCHSLSNYVDATKASDLNPQSLQFSVAFSPALLVAVPQSANVRPSAAAFECLPTIDRVVVFLHLTI